MNCVNGSKFDSKCNVLVEGYSLKNTEMIDISHCEIVAICSERMTQPLLLWGKKTQL